MKKIIRTWLRIGLRNWLTLLYFEIPYKVIGITLFTALMDRVEDVILKKDRSLSLNWENLQQFLKSPFLLLLLLAALLLLAYYVYFEITVLIVYSQYGWRDERLSVWRLFKEAFPCSLHLFRIQNLPVLLASLPIMGLWTFPYTSGLLNQCRIPEFMRAYLQAAPLWAAISAAVVSALGILLFFYLFRFIGAVLQGQPLLGRSQSRVPFLKGRRRETIVHLLFCLMTCTILIISGFIIMNILLWALSALPASIDAGKAMFQFYYTKWSVIGAIMVNIFVSLSLLSMVVTLYHVYQGEPQPVPHSRQWSPRAILLRIAAAFLMLGLLTFYSETKLGANLFHSPFDTKIVAHRGGADLAPENTIAALETSIRENIEIAEVDVQQTRDGVLIVMHDPDFKRTTGLEQKVWDTDYKDVQSLDAGSHFSTDFAGERIPTLKKMLEAAKDQIHLMIELKSTGHEHGLVEKTIKEIKATGMEGQCTVASMNLSLLKESKALAPEVSTVYITRLFTDDLSDQGYVDGYSVETKFLSAKIVAQVRSKGKKVYGWTANSKANMKKLLRLGTDGLVTDNPRRGQTALKYASKDYVLEIVTDLIFEDK